MKLKLSHFNRFRHDDCIDKFKSTTMVNFQYLCLLCFLSFSLFAQDYSVASISSELLENANAVVRFDDKEVKIRRHNDMYVKRKKVITFLDETAHNSLHQIFHYYGVIRVDLLKGKLYNANSEVIKRFQADEFHQRIEFHNEKSGVKSAGYYVDLSDVEYPFTLEIEYAYNSRTTAFIPSWMPLNRHYKSVEQTRLQVINTSRPDLKHMESNLADYKSVNLEKNQNFYSVSATHLKAIPKEDYQPALLNFAPRVNFSLAHFNLGLTSGRATSWLNLGRWKYLNAPINTWAVNTSSVGFVEGILSYIDEDELTVEKKVELIYNFVKDNHFIMHQTIENIDWYKNEKLGPTHLEYDACLNTLVYTKNLLQLFGINAFYALVNVNEQPVDLIEELPSLQGNQMMLYVPLPNDEIWLDCAAYEWPFNFLSQSKAQRKVMIVTKHGGELVFTPTYTSEDNVQSTSIQLEIDQNGEFKEASLKRTSKLIAFEKRRLLNQENQLAEDYAKQFEGIANLQIQNLQITSDSAEAKKEEQLNFSGKLNKNSNDSMVFSLSKFGSPFQLPQETKTRVTPFAIAKGFTFEDEIKLHLPTSLKLELPFKKIKRESQFGLYEVEIDTLDTELIINRKFVLNSGEFLKGDYIEFVKFMQRLKKDENLEFSLMMN